VKRSVSNNCCTGTVKRCRPECKGSCEPSQIHYSGDALARRFEPHGRLHVSEVKALLYGVEIVPDCDVAVAAVPFFK
jgi:hypothetical protein